MLSNGKVGILLNYNCKTNRHIWLVETERKERGDRRERVDRRETRNRVEIEDRRERR